MSNSPGEEACRYSAFISYAHEDERWAKWLQSALERYRVPKRLVGKHTAFGILSRRLAPVFRDRSDLSAATDLGETITKALKASANLIVICSPAARASRWVNEEIGAFRRFGRGQRIFCVIVAGEPNTAKIAGREAEECFPPALRFPGVDGTADLETEPIAADARPGGDGKNNVKLKVLAALLDVGFDVLKQREQRRRIRRLTLVAALSLVMMLITTGLAINAYNARLAAEQRQREAETLVDFMLGDLNDKLRQVQRLDILEAVDNQAMAYFLSRPSRELSDSTLALQVKALQKIGNVREDQGKLPAAMDAYRAASTSAAELMRRKPGDADREAAYAETLHHLGNAYWFQGDLNRALECFQQAIVLLERAERIRPSDTGLAVLAYARTNEGRVREARGEFATAKTLYESVLQTFRGLSSKQPGEIRWQSDLADAAESLAKVAKEQGQLSQAAAGYREVARIRNQIMARSPSDRDSQENLLITDGALGSTLLLCGDQGAGMQYADEAVRLARELVSFDATQGDWRLEFAKYSSLSGRIARATGHLDEAAKADREAVQALTELVKLDKTNTTWRRELARAQAEWGRLHLATGDVGGAQGLLDAALAALESEGSSGNRNLQLYKAETLISLGEVAARRGDSVAARTRWQQAREVIAPAAQVGADPEFLAVWARTLVLLGDADSTPRVLQSLAAMGYQTPEFDALLKEHNHAYAVGPVALRCGNDATAARVDEVH